MHDREGHGQHQRNGHRHHQPGTQAQREETHQQHDDHGFGQHAYEFAHRFTHRMRLVRDLAQFHAQRQGLLQALEFRVQRIAQADDVAAILHRHGQANRILAHETHAWRRRIGEAAVHVGDITQPQGAAAGLDGEFADVLDAFEFAADPQLQARGFCLEETGRGHRVLLIQRLLHHVHGNAQRGQLGVGQFYPDLFILQANQFHLAHVGHALQFQLDALGIVFHHRVVEAGSGQRIDVAEGIAEFVIEERADHAIRQSGADVADLLARLVPQRGDFIGMHGVARDEDHLRFARARVRADELVVAGGHQRLLDALGDLARDFIGGGARPHCAYHHHLEGELRVFGLAQVAVRPRADHRHHDHGVEDQAAMGQRPFGKIEAAHGLGLVFPVRGRKRNREALHRSVCRHRVGLVRPDGITSA